MIDEATHGLLLVLGCCSGLLLRDSARDKTTGRPNPTDTMMTTMTT
jgi:hypothetical protein